MIIRRRKIPTMSPVSEVASEEEPVGGRRKLLLPLFLTAVIYLASSANRAVIDYDEGHYAQAPLHMVESGDWVTPYVNGVRFLEKPPLMYWLTAVGFRIFGISEFALRLPTALAVIALVWVVTSMARRASGERAALVAGLCAAFSVGTFLFTREMLHDVWLVLFITLALRSFLEWYLDPSRPLGHALVFYASLAGAVMTKSLVGLAFPAGIVVLFFLLSRERPVWRSLHLPAGVLVFVALTVPWHWLAAVRNEGFLYAFFVNEQFLRFLGRHDPPVLWSLPLVQFWALIPVWFFPWTAFLPAAFVASRKPAQERERVLVRLVLAWLIVILGFFSVSGRLEHYAFPVLPALALIVGIALGRSDHSKTIAWGFRGLTIFGLAALAAAAVAGIWFATAGHGFRDASGIRSDIVAETDFSILAEMPAAILRNLIKPAAVTVVAMCLGFPAALRLETKRRRMQAVTVVALVMAVLCGMTHWSLVICEDMISSKRFALAVAQAARPGDRLVVLGDYESANSLNFYEPLRVQVYDGVAYALVPGMKFKDAPQVVLTRQDFEACWRGPGRVFALAPKTRLAELNPAGSLMLQVLDRVLVRNH